MQENYELVQRGFRLLLGSMSSYIGHTLCHIYKDRWWEHVSYYLSDQRDLPGYGEYGELLDSLDIANCIRIIDRMWNEVFRERLPQNCRTWAKELMGIRNSVAHVGTHDLDQPIAERALDTMVLLCEEIDPKNVYKIKEIYRVVRSRFEDSINKQDTTEVSLSSGTIQIDEKGTEQNEEFRFFFNHHEVHNLKELLYELAKNPEEAINSISRVCF